MNLFPRPVHRTVLRLCVALFAFWPAWRASPAQAPQAATVRGQVIDPTEALVPGARLALNSAQQPPLRTTSGDFGQFVFSSVPPGDYTLTVEANGFRRFQSSVTLKAGQELTLSIRLRIQIERQQFSVNDEELDSSPEHNLGAVILRGSDLDSLATNSQDLKQQLQIMTGSDISPQFFVNGFSADRLPPKSSILEIRMNQDPYSAQYDAPGSARIEILTKPGGDKLHGNIEMAGEDSALNSRNPYVAAQAPYSSFYALGNIDGPLGKTSSWFLTAGQENIGSQSFIHAVTSSSGPAYTQTVFSPQVQNEIAPRVDFQAGKAQTLSLRYDLDHEIQNNLLQSQLSLTTQAVNTRHMEHTFQFTDTQVYSPHLINITRFQFNRLTNRSLSQNGSASVLVQGAFNGGGNNLGQSSDLQYQYELQDHAAVLFGKHLLHFGGRLRDTRDINSSTGGFNGEFIFSSIDAYEATETGISQGLTPAQIRAAGGGASQFSITAGAPKIAINVADLGVYLEDEWKLTPNMTLTPGLRFETQTRIPNRSDLAPRLSYGWAIGAQGSKPAKVVLRAGAGMFYQRFTSDLVLNAARQNGVLQQQYVVEDPNFYPNLPSPGQLGPATLPTIYQISPRLRAPSLFEASIGLERQFSRQLFVHADYTWYRGIDLLLTRNINAPLPGTYNPGDPASGTRPLGTLQNIYQYQSEGASKRNRLYVNARYTTKPAVLYGFYVLGKRETDTQGATSFPSDQYDLHEDYGRAANDIRNRLYLGGQFHLPHQFSLNPFLIIESSVPFNITVGQDLNGDSQFNDRPAFATDLTRPSVYRTKRGVFDSDPLPGQQVIPINYGNGPSTLMLNGSFSHNLSFGPRLPEDPAPAKGAAKDPVARRFQLNLGIEAQNVLNAVNGGPPIGVLGSPLFGQSTSLTSTQFTTPQANRVLYLHTVLTF